MVRTCLHLTRAGQRGSSRGLRPRPAARRAVLGRPHRLAVAASPQTARVGNPGPRHGLSSVLRVILQTSDAMAGEPYPYVYVVADGAARALHAGERKSLDTERSGGDGAAPHITSS